MIIRIGQNQNGWESKKAEMGIMNKNENKIFIWAV